MANIPESERVFEEPVAWLVGRDLLGGIKGILLYAAYGSKLDPRDWMTGNVVPFDQPSQQEKTEFWFDYIADSGDGTKAMYSIAYLTMSNLWAKSEPSSDEGLRGIAFEEAGGRELLPRGEFLFFGGDTAYHVADYLTLGNRIQRPFTYAYEDFPEPKPQQRPVFGIPGNHDYYDQVDGFRRQFRKPIRPEPPPPPLSPGGDNAQLGLAGYYRTQEASYLAIKLPFGWWFWGLDTETGPLDNRQLEFFRTLIKGERGEILPPPKKLIIATSSPSTVFGKVADEKNDFKATQAIKELLGPNQPFLPTKRKDGTYDFSKAGDARMLEGQCRLDISGDVHHYARYWGPKPEPATPARGKADVPSAQGYASVVSGLGGAFHHPSNTYDDEIQEQVLYPTEKISREFVGREIFNFWSIRKGGYVWLFGFIIAFLIYFAASVTPSSRQDLSNLAPLVHLGLVQRETFKPTTVPPKASGSETPAHCLPIQPRRVWMCLGLSKGWPGPKECKPDQPEYFFLTSIKDWPKDLLIGTLLIFLSLGATIATFFLRDWLFGAKDQDPKRRAAARRSPPTPNLKLWLIVPPITLTVFLGMITVERYKLLITPFVSSLMVLFTIIIAAAGIMVTVRYNDYLFQKGHHEYVTKWDRFWPWALPVLSVLVVAAGLWSFGRNNLPAFLVTDILSSLVFVGALVALIILPVKAGGELLYTFRPGWLGLVGKLLIGLWHAVLQLFVPFVLVRRGTYVTWILTAFLVVLPMWPAARLFKSSRRVLLSITWVVYGALMLTLPWLSSQPSPISLFNTTSHFFDPTWFGAWGLLPSALAGVFGAVISCLWFGWYLGICSVFNGHNNEVGGAARIERFKQFIRFRVTRDGLTGYVIAVDDVSMIGEMKDNGEVNDGRDLKPKLIDVFHLTVKPNSAASP